MKDNNVNISSMYCTICGKRGIPINRRAGAAREAGHLKKLFCIYCNRETNHCEIKSYGKYTLEHFLMEYENHNFNSEGERILPFGQFKNKYYKELEEKEYARH